MSGMPGNSSKYKNVRLKLNFQAVSEMKFKSTLGCLFISIGFFNYDIMENINIKCIAAEF